MLFEALNVSNNGFVQCLFHFHDMLFTRSSFTANRQQQFISCHIYYEVKHHY